MKKMICLLLSVMLLLVGCGQEKVPETSAPPVTTEAPVTTVPETAPTTQATEPPQTYQAVVKAAMQTDETTGNGDGVGLLEDLDGDGVAEQVNPEGRSILLIQDGVAYALAEPLAGGQTLTAQDGVFIVKNAQGESRIYSRLRDGGIWPAG